MNKLNYLFYRLGRNVASIAETKRIMKTYPDMSAKLREQWNSILSEEYESRKTTCLDIKKYKQILTKIAENEKKIAFNNQLINILGTSASDV